MAIATRDEKQQVIEALKNANTKYAKPFEKGRMAVVSVFGGNWEEYAAIVMNMVVADTLLDIDLRQEQLIELSTNLLAEQRLTNRLLMRQLGLTQEDLDVEVAAAQAAIEQLVAVEPANAEAETIDRAEIRAAGGVCCSKYDPKRGGHYGPCAPS